MSPESILDKTPYYQSRDWLNLSGDHRKSLDLPYDMIEEKVGMTVYSREAKSEAKIRKPYLRGAILITTSGKLEFKSTSAAARKIGISFHLFKYWLRGDIKDSKAWPSWLLCFRQL
jgi:hypothetical protein